MTDYVTESEQLNKYPKTLAFLLQKIELARTASEREALCERAQWVIAGGDPE